MSLAMYCYIIAMSILEITEKVRKTAKEYGRYRIVADESGVDSSWLSKFAVGTITNPTVANVAKLESFFKRLAANTPQDINE
jgi:hypothetical protein